MGWQFPVFFRCLLPEDLVGLAAKEGGITLGCQIHPSPFSGKNYILQGDSSGIKLISHLIWAGWKAGLASGLKPGHIEVNTTFATGFGEAAVIQATVRLAWSLETHTTHNTSSLWSMVTIYNGLRFISAQPKLMQILPLLCMGPKYQTKLGLILSGTTPSCPSSPVLGSSTALWLFWGGFLS